MKYTSNNSNVSINDTLASKETKNVQVTLTYSSNISSSDLPTSNVSISNLGIDMVYEADQTAKTNSDGSTSYYTIGTELTVKNEKYNTIGIGEDYVTLLKQEPLTVAEVNTYGGVGTENNHVNMYSTDDTSASYYQQAYNVNGYGGMAYYSSSTCGYPTGSTSRVTTGCTTEYNSSEIKYVVDAWANDKFSINDLKTVDGYTARLITFDELLPYYPNCTSEYLENYGYCDKESTTPSWLYNSIYWYWAMSPGDSSTNVRIVDKNGELFSSPIIPPTIRSYTGAVRPVINVYKSSL